MTAEPTAAEIEAAARAGLDDTQWAELPSISRDALWDEAEDALTAALPLVEARLREQIAAEIEADAPRQSVALAQGERMAARIVRGA